MSETLRQVRRKKRRSERKAQFLKANPSCCFCGGEAPSVTIDHVPARSFFHERKWPEGYEFPACKLCNETTRLDELLFSLLARILPDPEAPDETGLLPELFKSIDNNFPGILEKLQPSARDVRKWLRDTGTMLPRGVSLSEVPILKTDHPILRDAIRQTVKKLALALYYKHSGRIVPKHGRIGISFFTNTTFKPALFSDEFFNALSGMSESRRGNLKLESRFNYQYAIAPDTGFAGFLIRFPQSMAFLVIVSPNGDLKEFTENDEFGRWIVRPFESLNPLS